MTVFLSESLPEYSTPFLNHLHPSVTSVEVRTESTWVAKNDPKKVFFYDLKFWWEVWSDPPKRCSGSLKMMFSTQMHLFGP